MMPEWLNTLSWWQWGILAGVPPLIVSLYFLKLKRQPLEVPSTYLWSRTVEDLHVNSIWQRLRKSLLLLLQLLAVLLIALALGRPGWKGTQLAGERLIFLVDNSASMSTEDVNGRSRLGESKRRIGALIDEMDSGEVAMIVSFADNADAVQTFTGDRRLLHRKLKAIQPTNRSTDPQLALRYAAGLANPGRQANDARDTQVADALPASLYIFSDGGFPAVKDFSLGHLEPIYVSIGSESAHNVGIISFAAERNLERADQLQAFSRIENGGAVDAELLVTLRHEGNLIDSQRHSIPAGNGVGVTFDLPRDLDAGVLSLRLENASGSGDYDDNMAFDNVAYTPINPPRLARILMVSHGNDAWELALTTERVQQLADVAVVKPSAMTSESFLQEAGSGAYDLIIFDMCSPPEMPLCNTLFLGAKPPGDEWKAEPFASPPYFLDANGTHPLMQLADMTGLLVAEGFKVVPPQGGQTLMEADLGAMLAIAPRRAYEDAVLGFGFFSYKDGKASEVLTNWHTRPSFPIFVMNVVKYLGGSRGAFAMKPVQPGHELRIRALTPVETVTVKTPAGDKIEVFREAMGSFVFSQTQQQGVYEVIEGDQDEPAQRFAVNLFNHRETSVLPQEEIDIDHEKVAGTLSRQPVRRELWKWILLGLLGLLTFEWYIYNRRVYL
ncbi:MAG: BatA and WFA domain-containing protein [Planctomycetales bacterium]|nr:BatA and WFA domain-containing protein [Planctomycetales bacterium]